MNGSWNHLGFLLILFSLALTSQPLDASENGFVYCRDVESTGLFEQCTEVRIIKSSQTRLHVYSLSSKKLLNVSADEVFEMDSIRNSETAQTEEKLLIPGSLMWTHAQPKTQSLCKVMALESSEIFQMQCSAGSPLRVKKNLMKRIGQSYSSRFKTSALLSSN